MTLLDRETDFVRVCALDSLTPDAKRIYELYDHENDPAENVNIAGYPENADLVKRLAAELEEGWRGAVPK